MELEHFQDIDNFSNYMINKNGDIYSKIRNKILKYKNSKGYNQITLRRDNKGYTKSIHRLLGIQFLPNPNNFPCIAP